MNRYNINLICDWEEFEARFELQVPARDVVEAVEEAKKVSYQIGDTTISQDDVQIRSVDLISVDISSSGIPVPASVQAASLHYFKE